ICHECLYSLKQCKRPKLSLANGLWIGELPYQLKNMTLPERLMIARHLPSAFIVKLYPKQRGATSWDKTQMHSNVSTYKLDPAQLGQAISSHDMPFPAIVLSATIGVTFVGPKGLPEGSMPKMFSVRRWKVREALAWLKENNPIYADITISEERLTQLPEDGIPDEI
ncbi:hypothetical protein CPC08DRAFT_620019, partial [Agrocybe pediades]